MCCLIHESVRLAQQTLCSHLLHIRPADVDGYNEVCVTHNYPFSLQPIENYNEWMIIFFISFLLLVGFFVLNMFVGVVVENFHKCREDAEREERLAQEERRRKKMERRLRREAGTDRQWDGITIYGKLFIVSQNCIIFDAV